MMNIQNKLSAKELRLYAGELSSKGFDEFAIVRKISKMTDDRKLIARMVKKIRNEKGLTRKRAYALSGTSIKPADNGYRSLVGGVFLISFGFFVKYFIAAEAVSTPIPFLLMGLGIMTTVRHFVSPREQSF